MSVIHILSYKLNEVCLKNIPDDSNLRNDKNLEVKLAYCMERIVNNTLCISLITIVLFLTYFSIHINLAIPCVLIIFAYISVRMNFGGWHLEKDWQCLIASVIIPVVLAYITVNISLNVLGILFIDLFVLYTIRTLGVVTHHNKPLKPYQIDELRKRGNIVVPIVMVVGLIVYMTPFPVVVNSIEIGLFVGAFNMWFGEK